MERLAQDEGGDLLYPFTRAGSDGTTGSPLSPLERFEKLAAWVPPPRLHPVRDAGGWAVPSKRRGAITPMPRQPGIEAAARLASSRWGWAGWLKRGFAIDMECGPRCPQGAWRIIAALIRRPVIFRILASPPGSSPAGRCPPTDCARALGARAFRLGLCLTYLL